MRASLIIVLCLVILIIGVIYFSAGSASTITPGLDVSRFEAGAMPGHIEALTRDNPDARRDAAVALWQIGCDAKAATPALIAAAKDPDDRVREAVVRALGHTGQGNQDAVPALALALKDQAEGVRAMAAASLAEIWGVENVASEGTGRPPMGARRDSPPSVKAAGAGGEPSLPPGPARLSPRAESVVRPAIAPLTEALGDAGARVRSNAAAALAEAGPLAEPAVEKLIQVVGKDPDDKARLQAGIALGSIGPRAKAAVPVLLDRLRNDEVDGIRANVAISLGQIHHDPQTVVPGLAAAFVREKFSDVRGAVARGLSSFGPDAKLALPLLRAAAKDPQYQQQDDVLQNINRLLKQMERNLPGESPARGPKPTGTDKKG